MTTPRRRIAFPVIALVAALALVLGTIGTTTVANSAAAITKAKVKKIAAKVVKKSAPTLAVASATTATTANTATNAVNLNGLPAASYQNQVYTFALPTSGASTNARTFNLPGVPPGNYLASYSVFAQSAAAIAMDCYFRTSPSATVKEAWAYATSYSSVFNTMNATAPLTLTAAVPNLQCEGGGNWGILNPASGGTSRVTLTRVDSTTSLTPTVTRSAVESKGASASAN